MLRPTPMPKSWGFFDMVTGSKSCSAEEPHNLAMG